MTTLTLCIAIPARSREKWLTSMAVLGTLTALTAADAARAQSAAAYPVKPITVIVSTGPGASNDIEARLYGEKHTKLTGQPVLIDYTPGAGTTIASVFVAKSAADGYTLGTFAGGFATSAVLYATLPYDPERDFAPISLMSKRPTVIVAHSAAPYKTLSEYIAYVKANPGAVNVSTIGAGSSPHLNAEWFHSLTGGKVTYVHYKSASVATPDLLAGHAHVTFGTIETYLPMIKAGRLLEGG